MQCGGEEERGLSDGEVDSETEDNDAAEKELGHWLEQLQAAGQAADKVNLPKRVTITAKQVMESFRNSILMAGAGDVDLDAILGDLCQLEAQISTQQTAIDSKITENSTDQPAVVTLKSASSSGSSPDAQSGTERPAFSYEWDDAIDTELQDALEALNELQAGENGAQKLVNSSSSNKSNGSKHEDLTQSQSGYSIDSISSVPFSTDCDSSETGTIKRQPSHSSNNKEDQSTAGRGTTHYHQHNNKPGINPLPLLQQDNNGSPRLLHKLETGAYQNFEQDLSPVSLEIDSAFSDTLSLPSSGSHGSVTTSGSQHSGGSSGVHSGTSGETGPPLSPGQKAVFTRLNSLQEQFSKENMPPNEQMNKLKAEKVKIAIEKIKEANIKKLFLRAHTDDGGSKSILVDEKMSVAHVCDILMAKNHVHPSMHWALVEQLPELYMERILEDDENLVENMLYWARDSPNIIRFVEKLEKYSVFAQPEKYLVPESKDEVEYPAVKREGLIKEYFDETNPVCPEVEGMVYLKADGKKTWKKLYFVLRGSGLYYNPKGKGKSTKDIVLLQKFEFADVFLALDWKKKFKAPTEYGFALKPPQVQRKTNKYIKYMCTEDKRSLQQWVMGIRIAKHGARLKHNYETMRNNVNTFNYRDIVPNANFNEYLAKQNEVAEKYGKTGHRISKTDEKNVPDTPSRRKSVKSELSSSSSLSSSQSHTASIKRHSTASITSAGGSSRHSMHSASSSGSLRRSPVKVVIPPTPEKIAQMERDPMMSGVLSSGDGVSRTSDDGGPIMIVAGATTTDSISDRSSMNKGQMMMGYESSGNQYGMDTENQTNTGSSRQQEVSRRGSAGYTIDDIPSCGIPSLPVTTKITKLITDQQAAAGTLRQSTRKSKKSIIPPRGEEIDVNDLPPPPPDPVILNIEDLPPPPDDMLPPPPPPPPQELAAQTHDPRARASLGHVTPQANYNTMRSPTSPTAGGNMFASGPGEDTSGISGPVRYATLPRSAPGTPKKVPPPPAPKSQGGFVKNTRSLHHGNNVNVNAMGTSSSPGFSASTATYQQQGGMKGSKTTYFISGLQRVLNEKHTRSGTLNDQSQLPPPPPEYTFIPDPQPSFEDLPPPPAELLEGLKQMRKKKPPPPPKRKDPSF